MITVVHVVVANKFFFCSGVSPTLFKTFRPMATKDPIAPHSAPISAYMSVHSGELASRILCAKGEKRTLTEGLSGVMQLQTWPMYDTLLAKTLPCLRPSRASMLAGSRSNIRYRMEQVGKRL